MNDHNELIERCKEICAWQDTGLLKGDALRNFAKSRPYCNQINSVSMAEDETLREVADAFIASVDRIAELESRLEISPLHNVDGIMARDATIKLQDEYIAKLESERAERERQEPVFQCKNCGGIYAEKVTQCDCMPEKQEWLEGVMSFEERPATAPVRLTGEQIGDCIADDADMKFQADPIKYIEGFARAIETAALRANGFKVDE